MSLTQQQIDDARAGTVAGMQKPKRGAEIFDGLDYPQEWAGFIGQVECKEQLDIAIRSALLRKTRLDHILFASGVAGVGKSTLATLVAYLAGKGFQRTSGPMTMDAFRKLLAPMRDGDILFVDECHRLVEGGRNKADWILPWMIEGVLYTDRGPIATPDVTLIGATTDWGKLPTTHLTRYLIQPEIVPYTEDEADLIALNLAERMHVALSVDEAPIVAQAGDANPRVMRRILTTLRDHQQVGAFNSDWDKILRRSKVTEDGLSTLACEILVVLTGQKNGTASIDTIRGQINEPGPLSEPEAQLMRRGLLAKTGQGRSITDRGRMRARLYTDQRRA